MDLQQRLWLAVLEGHIDEAQELIDQGANVNAATDLFKATALHRASLMGKSSAVNVLLKVGANVNQQDGDDLTALHMAANIGNRLIVLNLLRAGASIDAKNRDGRTPLHLTAINGDFKTSQLLISEKATIDATDRDGHTPLDLAKKKIEEKRDEGLTDTAEPWYRTVGLLESFHKKPSQDKEEASLLQNFGEEVESRFHKYLQQGSEEYYEINLMFIGQAGVGKTTLTKGLLGELDPYVSPPSTNGIDLHQHRCKYNRNSRHIYPVSKENSDHVLNQRIGNLIQMSLKSIPVQCSGSVPSSESLENASVCVAKISTLTIEQEKLTLGDNKKGHLEACSVGKTEACKGTLRNTDDFSEPTSLNAKSLDQQNPETSDEVTEFCTVVYERESQVEFGRTYLDYTETRSTASAQVKSLVNRAELSLSEETLEKLVPITIWDFGGQEVFYTTHQTFLSSSCIYIIVFNLFEFWQELNPNSRSENTLKTISFWINSVITYAKHTVAGYPKIVLVGTHADCFQAEERGNCLWKIFQKLEAYFRRSIQRQHLVINPRYFIDARDSEGVPFDLLRQCVMEIAESLPDWGLPIPHKWVVLENLIADLRSSGYKVVSVDKLQSMLSNEFHFQKQEIEDFLIFQHSYSKILYFKESHLHDNVILDPAWVIDALSSFITDERTRTYSSNSNSKDWENLRVRGKLNRNLIKDVWGQSDFDPFQEYLLNVLCRLDLITRSKSENFFYVPGMVTEKCPHQIVDDIFSSAEVGLVSFKISFKNNFLPPAIYNRIVAAFTSMFENSTHLAMQLFEDCAIFELSQNRWTTLKKDGYEILVFTYMSDRRGRAADLKAFRSVYSITLDCLRDLLKIYSAFQNPSVRQNDLPFQVVCQGCRKPNCYVSEKVFHDLDNYRCPYHGDYLCSVEVLEEMFGAKEIQEDRRDTVSTINNYLPVISPGNLENVECFLDYVASKLKGTECVFLAAALGFGVSLVERQRHEYSSQHELLFSILYNWQKCHSLSENVHLLFQALEDIEQKELVEEMKNFSLQKFVESACLINIPNPDDPISEEDLVIISKNVEQFKRLLRFVKFSQRCIDDLQLELRGSSPDYIALMMLSKWKAAEPNSTRHTLCAALLYIECRDLIDKLIQRWQQKMPCSGT